MTRLTMTSAMVEAIKSLVSLGQLLDDGDECPLRNAAAGNPISHSQVIDISKRLQKAKEDVETDEANQLPSCHLDDLLRGSKIYVEPTKPKTEQTSQYKALMARLRREEEDRAYERMINPLPPVETFSQRFPNRSPANLFPISQADIGEDDEVSYADINRQMALIINVLVSIVACSIAIWLAARHWSTPFRLGLSMGGSTMIGVAEIVVYAGYLRRIKEARERGKKQVEIKEIVKTWIIGREEKEESQISEKQLPSEPPEAKEIRRRETTRKAQCE